MENAKILWISDFTNPTGFGNVSRNLITHLKRWFEIDVLEYQLFFFEGEATDKELGLRIMGAADRGDTGSFKRLQQFNFAPYNAVFLMNDVWSINMYAHLLKMREIKIPVIAYFPVDAEEHNAEWYQHFDIIAQPITYTKFAADVVYKAAPQLNDRLMIMPHGVDTNTFYPIPTPKEDIRRKIWGGFMENPETAFVVFNGNRNQPRKKLDITLRAFSKFSHNKENVWLHMHCGIVDQSINIYELAKRMGIANKIIYSDMRNGIQNISAKQLNMYYNAADVGVNTSMGEGWGLVNVEHACTGAPQIVPNHSACRELFGEFGYTINSNAEWLMDNVMTLGQIPSHLHLADTLNEFYYDRLLMEYIGGQQMKKFTAATYSWERISQTLADVFNRFL